MSAYWVGCLAGPEVPWIWRCVAECATFEDIVLSCIVPDVQMCSCVFLFIQMFLYHIDIIICYVLWYYCVADVFTI